MSLVRDARGGLFRRYPPRRYRLSDYQRWFSRTADLFVRQLKHSRILPVTHEQQDTGPVGVVVGPWLSTAVPWYSIVLAIGLARRGRKVVLFWDDTGFPERNLDEQNRVIGRVLSYVGRFFPVVRISDEQPHSPESGDAQAVEELTDQNVAWRLRGAPPSERDLSEVREVRAALERALPLVRSAVARSRLDCLLVAGGVYGTSGLFRLAAEELGCRVATYDADLHVVQVCASGVAAQGADIPRAFDALWHSGDEKTKTAAIAVAQGEFQRRSESSDRYGFQAVPAQAISPTVADAVLIPLNVEWDTAALGRRIHFDSASDWLTSTVAEILEMDAGPVIVRQHPSERRKVQRSRLDVAAILQDSFGGDRRCRFVAADEPVNTYDLLQSARLVLPFVSTIAIEAAAIGKPVLISGASYYADLGFVWSAGSREEYFDLLRRGLRAELEPLSEQSDRAWICYYLAAVRNRIWTDFTPQPDDFWYWCRRRLDSLFAEPEVADILEAIDRDVPASLLHHHRCAALSDA